MSSLNTLSATEKNSFEAICHGLQGQYSVGIHILAVVVVLLASVLGSLLPLLGKHVPLLRLPAYIYAVGKFTGTGVMLAVGLIHMMGEAAEQFGASCVPEAFKDAYDSWAFLIAGIAIVLMHAIDVVIGDIVHGWYERRAAAEEEHQEDSQDRHSRFEGPHTDGEYHPDVQLLEQQLFPPNIPGPDHFRQPLRTESENYGCKGHQHGAVAPADVTGVQRVVAAVCMEFGVTLHSVLVGLDLGVTSDNEVKVLMVALLFHQLFEGLAMGARLADAEFQLSMEVMLMLIFSLSAPIGVGVGIAAITSSPTALSGSTYVMVSSILDSICGGILVYLALSLMLVDFPKDLRRLCAAGTPHRTIKKLGMFAGLWVGAGIMMLIGKWA